MNILKVVQGTDEWKAARAGKITSSDAQAIMGKSMYTTREELVKQKATGIEPDLSDKQWLFAKGHEAEKDARIHLEAELGEDLFPVVGTSDDGKFLSSFDGLTLDESIIFEHKLWNAKLADFVESGAVPDTHYWQLEMQLLVSGAESVLFVVSDGTIHKRAKVEYTSKPERRAQLLKGIAMFNEDVAKYVEKAKVERKVVTNLPALTFGFNAETGALETNLDAFSQQATRAIAITAGEPQTDDDFAEFEACIKTYRDAEDHVKNIVESVIAKYTDLNSFKRNAATCIEELRQARLRADKLVKEKKELVKANIINGSIKAIETLVNTRDTEIADWAQLQEPRNLSPANSAVVKVKLQAAIKSLRTLATIGDAVRSAELELMTGYSMAVDKVIANRNSFNKLAKDKGYIFPTNSITVDTALMEPEAFNAIIKSRIHEHDEALRIKMEQEAVAKKQRAEAEAKRIAESQRLAEEAREDAKRRAADEANRVAEEASKVAVEAKKTEPEPEPEPETELVAIDVFMKTRESIEWLIGLYSFSVANYVNKQSPEETKEQIEGLLKFIEEFEGHSS